MNEAKFKQEQKLPYRWFTFSALYLLTSDETDQGLPVLSFEPTNIEALQDQISEQYGNFIKHSEMLLKVFSNHITQDMFCHAGQATCLIRHIH